MKSAYGNDFARMFKGEVVGSLVIGVPCLGNLGVLPRVHQRTSDKRQKGMKEHSKISGVRKSLVNSQLVFPTNNHERIVSLPHMRLSAPCAPTWRHPMSSNESAKSWGNGVIASWTSDKVKNNCGQTVQPLRGLSEQRKTYPVSCQHPTAR